MRSTETSRSHPLPTRYTATFRLYDRFGAQLIHESPPTPALGFSQESSTSRFMYGAPMKRPM
jgi:hypothetical protein